MKSLVAAAACVLAFDVDGVHNRLFPSTCELWGLLVRGCVDSVAWPWVGIVLALNCNGYE